MFDDDNDEFTVPPSGMASLRKLHELHRTLCEELLRQLEDGSPRASLMNVARQFLKDNRIETEGEDSLVQGLRKLRDAGGDIPTFEDDDDGPTKH